MILNIENQNQGCSHYFSLRLSPKAQRSFVFANVQTLKLANVKTNWKMRDEKISLNKCALFSLQICAF